MVYEMIINDFTDIPHSTHATAYDYGILRPKVLKPD